MAFSSNYRNWRNAAISALQHEISEQHPENHASAGTAQVQKMPVKQVRTIGYWIKNMRHAG